MTLDQRDGDFDSDHCMSPRKRIPRFGMMGHIHGVNVYSASSRGIL
jgi:hypothetical protein